MVVAVIGVATSIITPLVNRISNQNEIIRTQKETIQTQDRLVTQLEVAGKLQDKMLGLLPPPGGTKT